MKELTKNAVGEESSLTVTNDQGAENFAKAEALADEVILGVRKISSILNKIKALKMYFDEAARDVNNRLKIPIKDCL